MVKAVIERPTFLEIIEYKRFPQPLEVGAVGMVFGKLSNGLTVNFFSELIYPFNLDADGKPSISLQFALNAICNPATRLGETAS
jgi:hypothetical protein